MALQHVPPSYLSRNTSFDTKSAEPVFQTLDLHRRLAIVQFLASRWAKFADDYIKAPYGALESHLQLKRHIRESSWILYWQFRAYDDRTPPLELNDYELYVLRIDPISDDDSPSAPE